MGKVIPWQENAKSPRELNENEASRVPSHLDVEKENARAASELDAKIHGKAGESRLKSLRKSTSWIETQVSLMNKGVERYAELEEGKQIDV